MEIDSKSWHFRFMKKVDSSTIWRIENDCGVTLCEYFWSLVLHMLLALVIVVMLVAGAIMMVSLPLLMLGVLDIAQDDAGPIIVFGGVIWVVFFGYLIYLAGKKYILWCEENDKENIFEMAGDICSKNIHAPQIFKDYWKAHKEKYCPVLEVKKDD